MHRKVRASQLDRERRYVGKGIQLEGQILTDEARRQIYSDTEVERTGGREKERDTHRAHKELRILRNQEPEMD